MLGYALKPVKKKCSDLLHLNTGEGAGRILAIIFTYVLVTLTWVFFRAGSVGTALDELARTFTGIRLSEFTDGTITGLGLGSYNLIFVIQ